MCAPSLSVIIPVYNEENFVQTVVDSVLSLAPVTEVVIVNDASTDNTAKVLATIGYPTVKIVTLPVNSGKGTAVRTGLEHSTGSVLVIQDADFELNPQDLLTMYRVLVSESVEVVYGSRFLRGTQAVPKTTLYANRFLSLLTSVLFGQSLSDMETCYKMFTRQVYQQLELCAQRFEIEPELTAQILKAGYQIREVPVQYHPRTRTQGKKIAWRDGWHAVLTLLSQRFFR